MVKSVNILGTKYKVFLKVDPAKDESLKGLYGICIPQERVIKVVDMYKITDWDKGCTEAKERQHRENLRHEVIHAFLHESGLWGSSHDVSAWAVDEEMTDWIAIQYPKIKKVFKQLDCEE